MNIYILSFIIAITFFISKNIVNKYIYKKNENIKIILKDCILIFICVIISNIIYENIEKQSLNEVAVFTDNPNF